MKLKVYSAENSMNVITGKAMIRINRKAGLFTFSKAAKEMIDLKLNDKVLIAQDEENPTDFYIHETASPSGFPLRAKTDDYGLSFNCSKLANTILPRADIKAVSYLVSAGHNIDGLIYHPIITVNPLNEKIVGKLKTVK